MTEEQPTQPPSSRDLPLRPNPVPIPPAYEDDQDKPMAVHASSASCLSSPGIKIDFHGDPAAEDTPPRSASLSAPAGSQPFQSPIRQHRRTPSVHREVKETLNARSEYTSDDADGRSHHQINQYVIKEEIGRGSYGAVHLATDQFGNEFAIKEFSKARLRKRVQSNILRHGPRGPGPRRLPLRAGFGRPGAMNHQLSEAEASESKDALFLIREEIAIMKKLNHPNLVQLIEVLDDPEEDSLYMVLEMCKKGVIMKVGLDEAADPYPEEDVRCWFRDLILGIEYLHSQGVVHRDIKPDNLLLTEDDVLKVVDFGVSEMFEKPDDMRTAKSAGSPAFLPPELCVGRHGEVSGKAADIWSMGVSLYCLRYGRIPFERSGVLEMYEAIKTETPKLPADEDPVFADMIQRLMDKDPEQRIKMEELREHPWVTKQGQDPLLSPEENCSDLVEFPNDLEVNHAFTQKMSHLLCVMKAISKFKGLLRQDSTSSISRGRQEISSEHDNSSQTTASKVENERSTSEHAAAVLRERERFFATASSRGSWQSLPGEKGHAHDPTDVEPLFLGIGTGSMDEFSTPQPEPTEPVADIVSDSPTAVDFNVYDRAFEAEVERIKRSSSRRKGTGTLYHTKHLHGKDRYQSDESVTWVKGSQEQTPSMARPLRNPRIADLVGNAPTQVPVETTGSQPHEAEA